MTGGEGAGVAAPAPGTAAGPPERVILHVDLDAFFAAVEETLRPELAGRPLLVGGLHRGVVAAANYPARAFGIRSAMPMAEARRRCPQAVVVPPRRERYVAASRAAQAIFRRFTPLVEPLSLDEAFLDVTGSRRLHGEGDTIARAIRAALAAELGLPASAGIAPNKFVAKLACDLAKPNGQLRVDGSGLTRWLAPLPIEHMWGVGAVTARTLRAAGIDSFAALAACEAATLARCVGARAGPLQRLARGLDDRPVTTTRAPKSFGAEGTFASDLDDLGRVGLHLLRHAADATARLTAWPGSCRRVTVVVVSSDFRPHSRAACAAEPIDDLTTILSLAQRALAHLAPEVARGVRRVGVRLDQLQPGPPSPGLLPDPARAQRRRAEAARAAIDRRFGAQMLRRASLLELEPAPPP